MSQQQQIQTNFLKGVDRRSSREDSLSPEGWWTLQNARILQRGETGKVERIKGFTKFNNNAVSYSDVLDIKAYLNFYIVYYRTSSGNFSVDVFDENGDVGGRNFTFTGIDDTDGKLIVSNETIYLSPHNKVLYYDEGTWTLEDYISSIPKITNITTDGGGSAFQANINVTSGASGISAKKSFSKITITRNNVPSGETDQFIFRVTDSGTYQKDSASITVDYTDNRNQIATKIKNAISGSVIENDWEVLDTFNGAETSDRSFFLVAKSAGVTWNGYDVSLSGSSYSIEDDKDFRSGRFRDTHNVNVDSNYNRRYDSLNSTIVASPTSGGRDAITSLSPITINISASTNRSADTTNIVSTDTATDIATKIETALAGVLRYYNVTRSTSTVTITAKSDGAEYDAEISLSTVDGDISDIFSHSVNIVQQGLDSNIFSGLGSYVNYWYKVRYRYLDGHVTSSTLPTYVNSGANENIILSIDNTDEDIDGTYPQIEIYRKRKDSEFFLINREKPTTQSYQFTDDGKTNIEPINEKNNIWLKKYNTQEIVDNYLIRANLQYFEEDYSIGDFSLAVTNASVEDNFVFPSGQKVKLYVRPKYEDGTIGFHKEIGTININTFGKKIQLTQGPTLVNNVDKGVSKLGVYADFQPFGNYENTTFKSFEFTNRNMPTIGDQNDYPVNSRTFFGFKYLKLKSVDTGYGIFTRLGNWDTSDTDDPIETEVQVGSINNTLPPDNFSFGGFNYIQVKKAGGEAIYKIDFLQALKDAISTQELYVSIIGTSVGGVERTRTRNNQQPTENINIEDTSILDAEVQVNALLDNVGGLDVNKDGNLILPEDTKLYLEFTDSVYDKLDIPINDYGIKRDYSDYNYVVFFNINRNLKEIFQFSNISFKLLNFFEETSAIKKEERTDNVGFTATTNVIWNEPIYNLQARKKLRNLGGVIYLGDIDNTSQTTVLQNTGFKDLESDHLNYAYLQNHNIYEDVIQETSININRSEYSTQLVWTDPLVEGNLYSGGRNVRPESFLTIAGDKGDILDIVSIFRRLYVFCENGVAQVNVGQIVTEQGGGQMFVDTSQVLTNYSWIADNLKNVKKNSIIKHNNAIYFTDGYDVYRISNGIENLTAGKIDLNVDAAYTAFINSKHNEYILCDQTNNISWSFGMEGGHWQGPHTFSAGKGSSIQETTVTQYNGDLVEHNSGNTFNGTPYTTILQNTANDTKIGFYDKNFRKFYIGNVGSGTLKYYKDITELTPPSKSLSSAIEKNGYKHIGIQPSEQNTKQLFWDIESTDSAFELYDMSLSFNIRQKRR